MESVPGVMVPPLMCKFVAAPLASVPLSVKFDDETNAFVAVIVMSPFVWFSVPTLAPPAMFTV